VLFEINSNGYLCIRKRRIEREKRMEKDRNEKEIIELVKLRDEKIKQKQLQTLNKSQTVDEIRRKN